MSLMRLTWPLALILLSCGQEQVFVSMRDPNYPLAVSGPVLRLTLRITNKQRCPSSQNSETSICLIYLSEVISSTPRDDHRVTQSLPELACRGKFPFFVTNYLEKGPDDNYRNTCCVDGNTAVHQAMGYFGYTRIVILRLLLEKGIDINARDILGNTALHLAVDSSGGSTESVVRLLLDHNIDVNIQNQKGHTALHLASKRGHDTIIRELLNREAKVDIQDNSGKTALHLAIKYDYRSIVNTLLDNGANVNAQDLRGLSGLHIATKHEDHAMARLLIGNGADAGLQDIYGRTVLHIVMRSDDRTIVELLLNNGANPDIPDRNGNTARALDVYYHFETLLFEAGRRNASPCP